MRFIILSVVWSIVLFGCAGKTEQVKAKYVFYFIGDGMGVNQVIGTEMYLAELEGRIGTKSLSFTSFPVRNYVTTYSGTNAVTCSAAAGTALATGTKTQNGRIGMRQDSGVLYSVAWRAKQAGKAVGVSTSVAINHATPAVFYAHQPDRQMYYEIGTDAAKAGFDFYGGAGWKQVFSPHDSSAIDLYSLLRDSGYMIIDHRQDFQALSAHAGKVVYVQPEDCVNPSSLPTAIDQREGDLTLADITGKAIQFLSARNEDGFFLMVEGGIIDWLCHANDGAAAFREVVDFSEAIQVALDFYKAHPDETLIIVTADHETGGLALGNGPYELNLKLLANQKSSIIGLTQKLKQLKKNKGKNLTYPDLRELFRQECGFGATVKLSPEEKQLLESEYIKTIRSNSSQLVRSEHALVDPLAALAVEILNRKAMIRWASGGHSAGAVPVYAIGVGAEKFSGISDNTEIIGIIEKVAGY
ncbi:alkaline phosphatase [Butyricimonas paravirosa]